MITRRNRADLYSNGQGEVGSVRRARECRKTSLRRHEMGGLLHRTIETIETMWCYSKAVLGVSDLLERQELAVPAVLGPARTAGTTWICVYLYQFVRSRVLPFQPFSAFCACRSENHPSKGGSQNSFLERQERLVSGNLGSVTVSGKMGEDDLVTWVPGGIRERIGRESSDCV